MSQPADFRLNPATELITVSQKKIQYARWYWHRRSALAHYNRLSTSKAQCRNQTLQMHATRARTQRTNHDSKLARRERYESNVCYRLFEIIYKTDRREAVTGTGRPDPARATLCHPEKLIRERTRKVQVDREGTRIIDADIPSPPHQFDAFSHRVLGGATRVSKHKPSQTSS